MIMVIEKLNEYKVCGEKMTSEANILIFKAWQKDSHYDGSNELDISTGE